ncbi:MAG: leucine-rich repeat domain-containing protein [Lachnospiraceae bacterium]|nr:leucine-rich repeat domain-containing protein [Lachnospiraceae bacterium]
MKRRITLLMASVMLAAISSSAVMASEGIDAIIVADENESVPVESEETDEEISEEEKYEILIEAVEEISEDEPAAVQEAEDVPATIAESGTCGDNLKWTLKDEVITVSGTGAMYDYVPTLAGIPEEVTPWKEALFIEETGENLTVSAVIEDGVTSIGTSAFEECSVEAITIADSVISIGSRAFAMCAIKSIELPQKLTAIEGWTFAYSDSLKEITIPSGVKSVGANAFFGCSGLTDVYYEGTAAQWAAVTISSEGNSALLNATIHCQSSSETVQTSLAAGKISGLTNVAKGIKIKWSAVNNADGYYIYRKTASGSYKKIKTITSASTVSYTDKKVVDKNGTTYTYKVVPYSGSGEGTGSEKTTVRLTGTALTSVKNSAAGKAKVKWTAVSSVTGYQIEYSASSSFASSKTKTVSGATKKSKTLTGLTKGTTYYVRIRTYKTVNGTKYYSAWSSKQKVTITK